jgi:hypothetical protein
MHKMIVSPANKQEFAFLTELFKKMKVNFKPLGYDIDENNDSEDWYRFALNNLSRAYSDDEPEYTSDMVKEPNPGYSHLSES